MYIIQHNDGRTTTTNIKAEARFYAWLSLDFSICNVYKQGGCILLSQYDIQ